MVEEAEVLHDVADDGEAVFSSIEIRGADDGLHSGGYHLGACEPGACIREDGRVNAVGTTKRSKVAIAQQTLPKLVPLVFV